MRKLIVNNFVMVDGFYEAKDKTIDDLFGFHHPENAGDQNFDTYAASRLRAAQWQGSGNILTCYSVDYRKAQGVMAKASTRKHV